MKIIKDLGVQLVANIPFFLALAGIASIVYAAFLIAEILGFVALGVALILVAFVLSYPSKGGGS